MGRKNEHKVNDGNGKGRVKFRYADSDRYVDIEMEGASETLADGLKSLANALAQGRAGSGPGRVLAPPKAAPLQADNQQEIPFPSEDGHEDEPVENSANEQPEATATGFERPKRRYSPPTPNILNDIDFNSGEVSLKDFVAQKSPEKVSDRYVVIASWYKQQKNIDEVTADRIYTAFKFLGWQSPDHVAQMLRDLKSKNKWFDKGTATGAYKINIIGLNVVDKMGTAK